MARAASYRRTWQSLLVVAGLVVAAGLVAATPPAERSPAAAPVGNESNVGIASEGEGNWPLDVGGGETCAAATVISSLPYVDSGSTAVAVNDYDEVCPFSGSIAPDVVYSYTPPSNRSVKISLCDPGTTTDYDTKLYVYQNTCPGTVIGCSDDACSSPITAFVSELTVALTAGNTYYIVVDGFGTEAGNYTLSVEEFIPASCPCPPGSDLFEASLDPLCGNDVSGDTGSQIGNTIGWQPRAVPE